MNEPDSLGHEASGKSLDSNSSLIISTEQGRFTQPVDNNQNNCLSRERFTDSVSAMIICRAHRKLALSVLHSHPSQDLWFPVYPLKPEQCYDEATHNLLQLVLSKESNKSHSSNAASKSSHQTYTDPQLAHTMRMQVPRCLEFVTRTLFVTELLPPVSGQCSCAINTEWITWYAFSEVLNLPNLHGPEPMIGALYLSATGSSPGFPENCHRSYEISIRKLIQATISGVHSELLQKSNCGPDDIQLVYSDYVQHCFPSPYMNKHSFCDYVTRARTKFDVTKDELQSMFSAFDSTNSHYIDFFDFVSGLAVLDKTTPHSNHCAKVRGEYIFRFYNHAKDPSTINYKDICRLAYDMMLMSSQKPDKIAIEKQVNKMYECFGVPMKTPVSKATFAKAIEKANFGDISQVLRVNSSIEAIKRHPQYAVLKNKPNSSNTCTRCRDKKYSLAAHHVTLQMEGCSVNPGLLHEVSDALQGSMAVRQQSDEIFASSSVYNQLMDTVRDFVEKRNDAEWSKMQHRIETVPLIKRVCLEASKLFSAEARVIKVQSPCFVFGDIHGNLHDLMSYEHIFWRIGAACLSNNFLFLGDYVDRGEHSVECALYLLCAKLLTPARFHLLRGNHEVRQIQRQFTFHTECISKFAELGNQVWQAFNAAFDCLPIAAVIDEKIYCAHGGIPASINKLDKLSTIPCPLESPMLESAAAWEIMWNDPITKQEFDSIAIEMQQRLDHSHYPVGFMPNTKRSTAFFFGDEATKSFLALNGLSHVIRAHEVVAQGFNLHFGGRVITVFSCSRYCGQDNQAACILVGLDNKLRVIKIDTYDKE